MGAANIGRAGTLVVSTPLGVGGVPETGVVLAQGSKNALSPQPDIPDALGFFERATRDRLDAVDFNHGITNYYEALAPLFQRLIDPSFNPATATKTEGVDPNWFAIASYASNAAGKGMAAADLGLRLCDAVAGGERSPPVPGGVSFLGKLLQLLKGVPKEAGALLAAIGLVNVGDSLDPRTLFVTLARLVEAYRAAPGKGPIDKVRTLCRTAETMLGEGNQSVFADMGVAGEQFLLFRKAHPDLTPEQICQRFVLPNADPAKARELYDFAVAHCKDSPRPSDFTAFAPTAKDGGTMLVAAFALYSQAGRTSDAGTKSALVAVANNIMTFREQRDFVGPAFQDTRAGEADRARLTALFTPAMRVSFGATVWNFGAYARHHLADREDNPLISPAAERNWATFDDRWPAILDSFDAVYQRPSGAWNLPSVPKPDDFTEEAANPGAKA